MVHAVYKADVMKLCFCGFRRSSQTDRAISFEPSVYNRQKGKNLRARHSRLLSGLDVGCISTDLEANDCLTRLAFGTALGLIPLTFKPEFAYAFEFTQTPSYCSAA